MFRFKRVILYCVLTVFLVTPFLVFAQGGVSSGVDPVDTSGGPSAALNAVPANNTVWGNIDHTPGIKTVWQIALGIIDFIVVAGLIVAAFANIFHVRLNDYGIKQVLPGLIIGIILANMSFFIMHLFIEMSSVIAQFIGNIVSNNNYLGAKMASNEYAGTFLVRRVTQLLFESLTTNPFGLHVNYSAAASGAGLAKAIVIPVAIFDAASVLWTLFIALLLMIVVTIFLLITIFLFYIRHYVLIVMFMLSPFAFFALGFPPLKKYWTLWWNNFWKWLLMGPVAFLLFGFAGIFLQAVNKGGVSGRSIGDYFFVNGVALGLLWFVTRIPFMWGSLFGQNVMGRWAQFGKTNATVARSAIGNSGTTFSATLGGNRAYRAAFSRKGGLGAPIGYATEARRDAIANRLNINTRQAGEDTKAYTQRIKRELGRLHREDRSKKIRELNDSSGVKGWNAVTDIVHAPQAIRAGIKQREEEYVKSLARSAQSTYYYKKAAGREPAIRFYNTDNAPKWNNMESTDDVIKGLTKLQNDYGLNAQQVAEISGMGPGQLGKDTKYSYIDPSDIIDINLANKRLNVLARSNRPMPALRRLAERNGFSSTNPNDTNYWGNFRLNPNQSYTFRHIAGEDEEADASTATSGNPSGANTNNTRPGGSNNGGTVIAPTATPADLQNISPSGDARWDAAQPIVQEQGSIEGAGSREQGADQAESGVPQTISPQEDGAETPLEKVAEEAGVLPKQPPVAVNADQLKNMPPHIAAAVIAGLDQYGNSLFRDPKRRKQFFKLVNLVQSKMDAGAGQLQASEARGLGINSQELKAINDTALRSVIAGRKQYMKDIDEGRVLQGERFTELADASKLAIKLAAKSDTNTQDLHTQLRGFASELSAGVPTEPEQLNQFQTRLGQIQTDLKKIDDGVSIKVGSTQEEAGQLLKEVNKQMTAVSLLDEQSLRRNEEAGMDNQLAMKNTLRERMMQEATLDNAVDIIGQIKTQEGKTNVEIGEVVARPEVQNKISADIRSVIDLNEPIRNRMSNLDADLQEVVVQQSTASFAGRLAEQGKTLSEGQDLKQILNDPGWRDSFSHDLTRIIDEQVTSAETNGVPNEAGLLAAPVPVAPPPPPSNEPGFGNPGATTSETAPPPPIQPEPPITDTVPAPEAPPST